MRVFGVLGLLTILAVPTVLRAQDRLPSPRGEASTQVGGAYDASGSFEGGSWIVVDYGRPILRGRQDMFGSGDTYGDGFLLGAPIWRIGANQSTRFVTETDLMFGGQRLPAGEYSIFADLGEDEWTLVFSTWGVKRTFQEENPNALWGAYEYTPDRDVLRTTMDVQTLPMSADQLIITFTDMTQDGGNFTVWWDDQFATARFSVAH
jgi:hypothetical protein